MTLAPRGGGRVPRSIDPHRGGLGVTSVPTMNELLTDYVTFKNPRLAARYADRPIPISTLYEAYFDGEVDIPGDLHAFLRKRNLFVKYTLTWRHLKWAV